MENYCNRIIRQKLTMADYNFFKTELLILAKKEIESIFDNELHKEVYLKVCNLFFPKETIAHQQDTPEDFELPEDTENSNKETVSHQQDTPEKTLIQQFEEDEHLSKLSNIIFHLKKEEEIESLSFNFEQVGFLQKQVKENKGNALICSLWANKLRDLSFNDLDLFKCKKNIILQYLLAVKELGKDGYKVYKKAYYIKTWWEDRLFDFANTEKLIPYLQEIISKFRKELVFYKAIGMHYYQNGNFQKAIEALGIFLDYYAGPRNKDRELVEMENKDRDMVVRYFILSHFKSGNVEKALLSSDLLERPENSIIRAGIYLALEDKEKALEEFKSIEKDMVLCFHLLHIKLYRESLPELEPFIYVKLKDSGNNDLFLPPTRRTPLVSMQSNGIIHIIGRIYPENCEDFFSPLIAWLDYLFALKPDKIIINFTLEYVNGAASKKLFEFWRKIEKCYKETNHRVICNFFYEKDEEDVLNWAEDISQYFKFEYNFIAVPDLFI